MFAFNFHSVASVLVEDGVASHLGVVLKARFGAKRPFIVTDEGLVRLGMVAAVTDGLADAGLAHAVYDGVQADPSEAVVRDALAAAKVHEADLIIGFGGGSSMDVAKLVAVLMTGKQDLSDIYGVDQIEGGRLALVQVPTTAGTGSEVTPIAIVTTGETTKMGVVDGVMLADLAVLDATLTAGLPKHITAATGIDAMVHAIEAYTSKIKKNPISDGLARQALLMLGQNIVTACEDGSNMEARRNMLIGAMLAGQAFANAPVAAVHALAYPLGGHYHIPHGLSNALVLPHVLRFNEPQAGRLYGELAGLVGLDATSDAFIGWLDGIADTVGIERRLRDMGISHNALPMLAEDAMLQQRLLVNNPREVTLEDARAIYEAAW
ncbi:iron-containing alcohol dehydrogenase [Kordiimonas marina]|uniref:iron-containing alcohol dehydrogenase n=1 Tax=Kordiimonas marina TaxID=2872312 RepID=UPI001FF6C9FC|nr:iron-containing alcohol dehydrogenase [Kordiimonas marina]MCJ9429099.1 iron-containing alcohol dehydrogenase [Kordiimonas marina]